MRQPHFLILQQPVIPRLVSSVESRSPARSQVMLQKAVIAAGGGVASNTTTRSNVTIGQAVAGTASNATTKGQIGFWTSERTSAGVRELAAVDLSLDVWPNPASKVCNVR